LFIATVAIAGTVGLNPLSTAVGTNSIFALQVTGSGFTESLVGGGFNLSFDPSLLTLNSVSIASIWNFAPSPGTIGAGSLTDASFNVFPGSITGDFPIATLNFTSKGTGGNSAVTLMPSSLFPFADISANVVTPNFVAGSVQVTAATTSTPEPATYLLVGLGLIIAMVLRKMTVTAF